MIKKIFLKIRKIMFPTGFDKAVRRWFDDDGDRRFRLRYDFNKDSVVFDLGGYHGDWASDIYSMYMSKIYVFEPVESFFECIEKRFCNNSDINVFCFGLGVRDEVVSIYISEDSSSLYGRSSNAEDINVKNFIEFVEKEKILNIDLVKMNIEGGEYDLIDFLIDTGFISNIINLQVQFHDCVPDAYDRMKTIQNKLSKTHVLTYQYSPYVWENWCLIK